ncbi:nuclear transport factor 2 family protein [Streptomyces sp. NPDC090022]|uniref:nuclear transport factor 2 family protein n=1 Tax=Streptomyces sp. NPDC090022 TaxID=3365920 RepID=UPI00381DF5FB
MPSTEFAPERRRMLSVLGTVGAAAGIGTLAAATPAAAAPEELTAARWGVNGPVDDEVAIQRLIDGYLFAVDTKDKTFFRTLWTEDATLTVMAHPDGTAGIVKSGIEAIVANLDGAQAWGQSTHVKANVSIRVSGRTATADSFATAQLVYPATATAPETVVVRGLRYRDAFVKTATGWKLRGRVMSPLWQFNGASVPIVYPN